MKSFKVLSAVLLVFFMFSTVSADVNVGISAGSDGLKGFYLSIGEHYQVSQKQVVSVKKRNIPDEEMPVGFFIAEHANVRPSAVFKLRQKGKSWMEITAHFGLTSDIYYIAFKKDPGPPYGKAWGHFKNKKRTHWSGIQMSDVDIVNFVNLKFVSQHLGFSMNEVIKLRSSGKNFVDIDKQVKNKQAKNRKAVASKEKSKDKGKSKGKGKKK